MALSTPASGTKLGGRLPPAPPPEAGAGGQTPPSNGAGPAATRGTSLSRDALRRLMRNRLAMAGGIAIALLCLIAIFADVLAPLPYTKTNFSRLNEAPSRDYPLGTH